VFHTVHDETRSVDTDMHTADEFAAFFKDKVDSVRAFTDSMPSYEVSFWMTTMLDHITPVTVEEVDKLCAMLNLSARSGANLADEGNACVDLTSCVVVAE